MKYINDWDKRKERFKAFWEGEVVDRPVVTIYAPSRNCRFDPSVMVPPKNKEDILKYWTDGEWILKRARHMWENLTWVGDKFPLVWLNMGTSEHAAFFKGVEHEFTENTIWFHGKYDKTPSLIVDDNSFWYKKTLEAAKYLVNESKGDFVVSMSDCTGNADALAIIQGTDNLLMDMYTGEEYIKPSLIKIQEQYEKIHREIYDIVRENNDGGSSVGWMNTWAPGLSAQLQCDLSVMISPELYEKYILEELEQQANLLDYGIYHLDGFEQTRHLDHILSVKNIKAIQWQNVAGQPSPVHYIEHLKRIQAAGKSLLVFCNDASEVEPLMEQLSSKGLHLFVPVYTSEDDAVRLLKTIEKLTHE